MYNILSTYRGNADFFKVILQHRDKLIPHDLQSRVLAQLVQKLGRTQRDLATGLRTGKEDKINVSGFKG